MSCVYFLFPVLVLRYSFFQSLIECWSFTFIYTVQEVLKAEGYVASNTEKYPLGGVITAIQNAFHTTPEIECSGDAIEELYLCFYKDFKVRHMCSDILLM